MSWEQCKVYIKKNQEQENGSDQKKRTQNIVKKMDKFQDDRVTSCNL